MNIQITQAGVFQSNQVQTPDNGTNDSITIKQNALLSVGQVLSGRIASIDGNHLSLLLDGNRMLSATVSGKLNLTPGQLLSFEVKSTNNNQTELRPLFTNLNSETTMSSALREAGLPVDDRNISMVETMMKEGMAVNKQALLDMVSHLMDHPDISAESLVLMNKLGLEMDESSVHQFENYRNFEHQIIGDVQTMSDALAGVFGELEEMDPKDGAGALLEIMSMAQESDPKEAESYPLLTEESVQNGIDNLKELLNYVNNKPQDDMAQPLLQGEDGTDQTVLNLTNNLLKTFEKHPELFSDEDKEALSSLFRDDKFMELLSGRLTNRVLLKPQDVSGEGKVEELYQKLLEFSTKTQSILDKINTPQASQAMRSASNLSDNMSFMSQLNELMTYVQLPLKMNEEKAHGDLYVYSNKKKLMERDGNYTALLHLDMEHLGPMDVHVAMQNQRVTTHFYMQDAELLDFMESYIHLLDERLEKKGYTMSTSVSVKEKQEKESVVERFLEQKDEGTVAPLLSKLSFDVRA